jgi:hypothetical protein
LQHGAACYKRLLQMLKQDKPVGFKDSKLVSSGYVIQVKLVHGVDSLTVLTIPPSTGFLVDERGKLKKIALRHFVR